MRRPPNKPTEEFGHVAFGKSGEVRKRLRSLSSVKLEQEAEVAQHFCQGLSAATGCMHRVEMLAECDRDFRIVWKVERPKFS